MLPCTDSSRPANFLPYCQSNSAMLKKSLRMYGTTPTAFHFLTARNVLLLLRETPFENRAFSRNPLFSWEKGEMLWSQKCGDPIHTQNKEKSQKMALGTVQLELINQSQYTDSLSSHKKSENIQKSHFNSSSISFSQTLLLPLFNLLIIS